MFIVIRIRFAGGFPHTSCPADQLFIAHPHPRSASPFERRQTHECLVVETRNKKTLQQIINGPQIKPHAGPRVLALCHQPVIEFLGGSPNIRIASVTRTDCDQSTRFLNPRRHNAARPMVFETPAQYALAIGHQGGCKRIACITR